MGERKKGESIVMERSERRDWRRRRKKDRCSMRRIKGGRW